MFPSSQSGSLRRTSSMQRVRQMVSPFGSMRDEAKGKIDSASAELNALSHDLWSHPETPYNEFHAHDLLTTFLEHNGFEVERNFILPTAFRATYGYDGGRAVAVLAEYDAQPIIGHASGHNLVAECAVGVAVGVKAALESMEPKVQKGKIMVIGCPASAGAGKQKLINAGVFFGVSASLLVSPFNTDILKPTQEALEKIRYTFHGASADASLAPWDGKNALDAAVQCYSSIAAIRQHLEPNIKVHGIFLSGGEQPNIIPDLAELLFHVEAPTTAELQPAVKKCEDCALGAANATQCTVEIQYGAYFAEVKNNQHLSMIYKKHCHELGLKFPKDQVSRKVSVPTDMGNVSFVTPSIHAFFDISTVAQTNTKDFAVASGAPEAQKATLLQAKALALTAIDLLQPGGSKLIDSINKEFQKVTPPTEVIGQIPVNQPGEATQGNKETYGEAAAMPMQNGPVEIQEHEEDESPANAEKGDDEQAAESSKPAGEVEPVAEAAGGDSPDEIREEKVVDEKPKVEDTNETAPATVN